MGDDGWKSKFKETHTYPVLGPLYSSYAVWVRSWARKVLALLAR
jgi:hypothetical protein